MAGTPRAAGPHLLAAPLPTVEEVQRRLASVRARIEAAGRPAGEVVVVAVTKGFGPGVVEVLARAGATEVGENFAQELVPKAGAALAAGLGSRWHFLGPVQRNKVRSLAAHVWLWQGVDRVEAGAEIARRAPGARVLVQVNLSGLPTRPGCQWERAPSLVDELRATGLRVEGLMGMAGREGGRHRFRRLADLAAELEMGTVSMGTSADFETAVQEGSTMVRLGTALLGARPGAAQVRR